MTTDHGAFIAKVRDHYVLLLRFGEARGPIKCNGKIASLRSILAVEAKAGIAACDEQMRAVEQAR